MIAPSTHRDLLKLISRITAFPERHIMPRPPTKPTKESFCTDHELYKIIRVADKRRKLLTND